MIDPKLQVLFTAKNDDELTVTYAAYVAYIRGSKDHHSSSAKNAADMLNSVVIIDWDRLIGTFEIIDSNKPVSNDGDFPADNPVNNPIDAFGINPDYISLLSLCMDYPDVFMEAYNVFKRTF